MSLTAPRRALLGALLAVVAAPLSAQVTVPPTRNEGNCVPFGCEIVTRYQQLYAASAFGASPLSITSLTFFNTVAEQPTESNRVHRGTYQIYLSTSPSSIDSPNTIDMNANRGSDFTLFATLTVAGTLEANPTFDIVGTAPFLYTPSSGNLLLEILPTYTFDTGITFFDVNADFALNSTLSRRLICTTAECNTADNATGDALVTRFNTTSVVPEPSTYALLATGLVGIVAAARRRRR